MSDSNQKNNKGIIIILALFFIVIIALIAVIAYLLGRGNGDGNGETSGSADAPRKVQEQESVRLILDEESAQDVIDEMRKEVEDGMFECEMSMKWTFADGKSESKDSYVANSTNNKYPFYFDVTLRDTGELVYSSAVLPVGAQLTNIKLDKELPAGAYNAIAHYTLIRDTETQEVISTAGFGITIIVEN